MRFSLGDLLDWELPEYPLLFGSDFERTFSAQKAQLKFLKDSVAATIEPLSYEYLASNTSLRGCLEDDILAKRQSAWRTEAKRFTGLDPLHRAALGDPNLKPDYLYWAIAEHFKQDEVTCLTLGIEPTEEVKATLYVDNGDCPDRSHPKIALRRRHDLVVRRFGAWGPNAKVEPIDLAEWASKTGLEVHPGFDEMLRSIRKRSSGSTDDVGAKESAPVSKLDGRERTAMSKLIAAMAIDAYGYDPKALRSEIPNEIQGIADRLGLSISANTIRKYLKQGAELVPDDWEPQ